MTRRFFASTKPLILLCLFPLALAACGGGDNSSSAPQVSAANSTITAAPTTVTADGTAAAAIAVILRDTDNQPYTGSADVVITAAPCTHCTLHYSNNNGQITGTLSSTVAEDITLSFTVNGVASPNTAVVHFTSGWAWFAENGGTYWIVPQSGIYSIYHFNTDKFAVTRGQTVFHITDYFNGYWTGVVKVDITRGQIPSCQYVLGQVTPEGRVHMTMYDTGTGGVVNYPIGTMVKKDGAWTMVNEMTSLTQGGGTLSHWAYMVQSKPSDPTWNDLPFVHESIPTFMSGCPEGPPILHKPASVPSSLLVGTDESGKEAVIGLATAVPSPAAVQSAGSPREGVLAHTGKTAPLHADSYRPHSSGAYKRWQWFKDTYWIVPQSGIYSIYHFNTDKFAVTRGQTVFHITDYFNGYWTGVVKVDITRGQIPSCQYVLGQVTPEGRVYMTMYDTGTREVVNYPIGTMVKKDGAWTMVNEMTSLTQGGGTLSHWAYMVQSKPSDPTWNDLPFVHESIPEFMSGCPEGPPILHKPALVRSR